MHVAPTPHVLCESSTFDVEKKTNINDFGKREITSSTIMGLLIQDIKLGYFFCAAWLKLDVNLRVKIRGYGRCAFILRPRPLQ